MFLSGAPGHHVQIDVKFLDFPLPDGQKARRFQYTAIDDATRIRALKIYEKHTQENVISFLDYVVEFSTGQKMMLDCGHS